MKTFYFAEVNPEDFDYTDKETVFCHEGRYYWHRLLLEEDQIVIEDTCDRHMPLCLEQIQKFSHIISHIAEMEVIKMDAQNRIDELLTQMDLF
jgi:hypothetical protein